MTQTISTQEALEQFLLRMGDNTLILGHRVSEWCGHAPVLEEDIAMANVALDLIGQTQYWLGEAANIKGGETTADTLAYRRDAWDFRNFLLVELPNKDFGYTLMRQFLFDVWHYLQLDALQNSSHEQVREIAQKALKEVDYHLERSSQLIVRLGNGTDESHRRMQEALEYFWSYTGEFFVSDDYDEALVAAEISVDPESLREKWLSFVGEVLADAQLEQPEVKYIHSGGRKGVHTEYLGHLLAEMQFLPRAYPDATQW
ncbi:MAG TPA: 1,2-phenylacetyl-CoA epoxidase subunit PaaC [Paenalcaligenes sp.]|nr:1,2-phenylacetyl-CoA epoxidase subunit PaaC [Paenalcaligenes sp.]